MVEIKVVKDGQKRVRGLSVEGHAGFSDDEHGGDIVCAAVSALVGYLGIMFTEVRPDLALLEVDHGYFSLTADEAASADSCFTSMLDGWIRAMKQLEENYRGWVKVEESTV